MTPQQQLNLRIAAQGLFDNCVAGIQFSVALPFVSVARWNGRCYLHNGYNRAYGLRRAGALAMPCILRDVDSLAAAGVKADGTTFAASLLAGNDAPTMGHFSQGRAHEVTLRAMRRVIHVSWAEYAVPDE